MVSNARLRCAAESDTGRMRSNNEDRVHCDPERGIFLVVDGIGGHAAGEKAADVAVAMIRNRLERQTGTRRPSASAKPSPSPITRSCALARAQSRMGRAWPAC